MKRPSIADIANSLNVSKTLVSLVLNGHGDDKGINKETQKKVIEKAGELNYKPNLVARGLRLGVSKTIGVIVADISNKFYSKIAKRIEDVAGQHGYHIIFCSSDENPKKEIDLINTLRERQVDGLIISTCLNQTDTFKTLKKELFPFVLIDRFIPKIHLHYVGVNNRQGGFDATEYMINKGFHRIGFIGILPAHLRTIREREFGYRDALKKYGIRVRSNYIRHVNFDFSLNEVYQIINELLHPPHAINAIFSSNNRIAVACMDCFRKMNLKIPQDVAMICFDDIDLFRFSNPAITSIAQPVEDIGEKAFNILLEAITSQTNGNWKQEILPVRLIERYSCGENMNYSINV